MNDLSNVLRGLSEEQWHDLTDGHTLFKPSFYTKMGFPEEFVQKFNKEIESDLSSPLSTIFDNDGQILETIVGIYNLEFLRGLQDVFQVKIESCFGRGREARYIISGLQKKLNLPVTCE